MLLASSPGKVDQKGDHRYGNEQVEKNLGDASGTSGNAAKTKDGGDDGEHQKYQGKTKHGGCFYGWLGKDYDLLDDNRQI
jgi:hypothetical protein